MNPSEGSSTRENSTVKAEGNLGPDIILHLESQEDDRKKLHWIETVVRQMPNVDLSKLTWLSEQTPTGLIIGEGPDFAGIGNDQDTTHAWWIKGDPNVYYYGQMSDQLYNGYGVLFFDNDSHYIGSFLNNNKSGQGQFTYAAPTTAQSQEKNLQIEMSYNGGWQNDKKHGHGKLVFRDGFGSYYEGSFKDGWREGRGIYFDMKNGWKYDGEWMYGKYHGKGKMQYKKGFYEGEWVAGQRHGEGKMVHGNGDVYTGGFANGGRDGLGTLYEKDDGHQTTCKWRNGEIVRGTEGMGGSEVMMSHSQVSVG